MEESCIEPQEKKKSLKNMPKNELNADSNLSTEPLEYQVSQYFKNNQFFVKKVDFDKIH